MVHKRKPRLCFVSSSGGHWEQLQKLLPLAEKYEGFFVTEKTQFETPRAKYFMKQTDLKDKFMVPKMIVNSARALVIWIKERPDFILQLALWWHILSISLLYSSTRSLSSLRPLDVPTCPPKPVRRWRSIPICS